MEEFIHPLYIWTSNDPVRASLTGHVGTQVRCELGDKPWAIAERSDDETFFVRHMINQWFNRGCVAGAGVGVSDPRLLGFPFYEVMLI